MNFFSALVVLGMALAASAPAAAQSVTPAVTTAGTALPPLPQTMMLVLQGKVTETAKPVDLSLAVAAPDFSVDLSLANTGSENNPVRLSFNGTVQLKDGRYWVNYVVKWQVPVIVSSLGDGRGVVQIRAFSLENSIYLRVGVPVTLQDNGGKKLTLTIRPIEKPPSTGTPSLP